MSIYVNVVLQLGYWQFNEGNNYEGKYTDPFWSNDRNLAIGKPSSANIQIRILNILMATIWEHNWCKDKNRS